MLLAVAWLRPRHVVLRATLCWLDVSVGGAGLVDEAVYDDMAVVVKKFKNHRWFLTGYIMKKLGTILYHVVYKAFFLVGAVMSILYIIGHVYRTYSTVSGVIAGEFRVIENNTHSLL